MLFFLFPVITIIALFIISHLFWLVRFKKNTDHKIPILVYHKIGDRFEWGITRQKVGQFEQQIRYLKENGYQSVKADEFFQSQVRFRKKSFKVSRKVLITFDDGYESAYNFAFPVLQKYGFSACIFLISGYIGKYNEWDVNWGKKFKHLSWNQIKEMEKYGFSFGSHTVNHPDLTKLGKRNVEYELKGSLQELEDNLGKKVDFVSFPFGKYNPLVEELAQKVGYLKAFTICSSSKNDNSDSFVLERKGMYLFDSPLTLSTKINGGPFFWIEDLKGRIINTFANGTTLVKKPNYDGLKFEAFTVSNQRQS